MDAPVPTTERDLPPAPVDGQAVLCPLCTYDLRGLIEPRCPECGYQFVWAELLNEKRKTHPYLFEHHPRNSLRSFSRTAIEGFVPIRFWRTLRPQMTPRPGRLYQYWILCTLLPALLGILLIAARAAVDNFYPPSASISLFLWRGPGVPLPPQPRPGFADNIDRISELATPFLLLAGLIVFWTICTYLALLVFQQTMNKAQIRRIHVLRCVGYSFDLGIWCGAAGLVLVAFAYVYAVGLVGMDICIACFGLVTFALIIFAGLRLWAACRLYLVFDHAFWVALTSQIMVGLFFAVIVLNWQYIS
jgi:hypothetical protein